MQIKYCPTSDISHHTVVIVHQSYYWMQGNITHDCRYLVRDSLIYMMI